MIFAKLKTIILRHGGHGIGYIHISDVGVISRGNKRARRKTSVLHKMPENVYLLCSKRNVLDQKIGSIKPVDFSDPRIIRGHFEDISLINRIQVQQIDSVKCIL